MNSQLSLAVFFFAAILYMPCPHRAGAQEITVRNDTDFTFMDPALITNSNDYTIAANIYSGLLKFNPKTMEPEPDLAKSWTISPDGLTYTFNLRDNVQWHKGYGQLTARDVKYSFDRIMDPRTKSRYRTDFQNVRDVEVVSDHTVKIHFKTPDMSFVRKFYLPPGLYREPEGDGGLERKLQVRSDRTGPFILTAGSPARRRFWSPIKITFLDRRSLRKQLF